MEPTNKEILDQLQAHDAKDMARFDEIIQSQKRILLILEGDRSIKRRGLVEMVDDHENKIQKAIWTFGIFMAIGSLLGFIISKL